MKNVDAIGLAIWVALLLVVVTTLLRDCLP
jgi:hypothetical protein